MKMNIMISINRAYIRYACIMLMSLKEHHKGILLSVYILHNELQDEDFRRMDEVIGSDGIELIPVFIPEGTVKDFQIGKWPEVAAYRLLAADLFAGSMERILHLDVDILVTGDISEFYNTPFEDNYLVACEDYLLDLARRDKCRALAKDENTLLFNSGVLLFNIPKLSADGFYYSVYAEMLRKYPDIPIEYPDQDILNFLFCDKTKYMNRIKYNYVPRFYQTYDKEFFYNSLEGLKNNCHIIHMASGYKPWENIRREIVDELWWEYAKRTPFYLDMKEKHIRSMLYKDKKILPLIEIGLTKIIPQIDSKESVLLETEEQLYQILEREFELADILGKLV